MRQGRCICGGKSSFDFLTRASVSWAPLISSISKSLLPRTDTDNDRHVANVKWRRCVEVRAGVGNDAGSCFDRSKRS